MRYSFRQVHHRSILLPILRLTPPTEGFPWDDIRKLLYGGPRLRYTAVKKLLPKTSTAWAGRTNVQVTDRRIC